MALDPDLQNYGIALVKAIARANRHPDPEAYAAEVVAAFAEPVSAEAAPAPVETPVDTPPLAPAETEAQ